MTPDEILATIQSANAASTPLEIIGHEIVERNHGTEGVVLVGLQRGGVWIARELQTAMSRIDVAP